MKRTDLARELIDCGAQNVDERIKKTEIIINDALSKKFNKPQGRYISIETDIITSGDEHLFKRVSKALMQGISIFTKNKKNILIVGLGNPNLTADNFGPSCLNKIYATRHIKECKIKVSTLLPNVLGVTGIESYDIIKGVCDKISPDLVVIIDSLCASDYTRLCNVFQLTDSGITPGSGVNNHRYTLSKETLNCDVLCIGMPTVVYARELIANQIVTNKDLLSLIVTPKDIDRYIQDTSLILADSVNYLFFK